MSQPKDIFRWLWDAGQQIDGVDMANLWQQMRKAHNSLDEEGVRGCSREFTRLGELHEMPWLGVFGRHWELQFRLLGLSEGESAVADAVAAFEQANREETADCPQSICTAQDLCIAYRNVDGPGYAPETLAAAQDTLARIDTSWPCWDCLAKEEIYSLELSGDWEQVIARIDSRDVELRSAGQRPSLEYRDLRLGALLELNRDEEAVAFFDETVLARYSQHSVESLPLFEARHARSLHRSGRTEEALEAFAKIPSVLEKPRFGEAWRRLADELLATGDLENSDGLAAVRIKLGGYHKRHGAWRRTFECFAEAAIHAAQRGALDTARRARAECIEAMEHLARPVDAPDRLAAVDAAIAAAPQEISEHAPAERRAAELEAELADEFDADTFVELSGLLSWIGWENAAVEQLWEHVRAHPSESNATFALMGVLSRRGGPDKTAQLTALADLVAPEVPENAHWIRANLAAQNEAWDVCASECESLVATDDEAINTRRLWARSERFVGNFQAAANLSAAVLDRTVEHALDAESAAPDPEQELSVDQQAALHGRHVRIDDCWAAIMHGSLAEDWALVRSAGSELGMTFSDDAGPVNEEWGMCNITIRDDDGQERSHGARRTGPVTAIVTSVAPPGRQQRLRDAVVFDPAPLDPVSEDLEEAAQTVRRYASIHTVSAGGCTSYWVESAFPGDAEAAGAQWASFRDAMYDADFPVWSYDGGTDTLTETGEQAEVVLLAVAHGPDTTPIELHETVNALVADWPHPVAWPALAEAAGEDSEAHRQRLTDLWIREEQ